MSNGRKSLPSRSRILIVDDHPIVRQGYRENIKQKLHLRSATQLVQTATKWVLDQGG